jgi:uncharacterized protein
MTRGEAVLQRFLRQTRTIAVIGASPRRTRHSNEVVRYLHLVGYDVIPVRQDRAAVEELPTYARLVDVAGPVDVALIFRRAPAVIAHVREAIAKGVIAVWFPPGAWSREGESEARSHDLSVIKDRCIIEDHRHLVGQAGDPRSGHPVKTGVYISRRRLTYEDNRPHPGRDSFVIGGGGGQSVGGGKHTVLDEKKMLKGRPSPRRGPIRRRPL